jgi:hypothetical protein
MLTFFDLFLSQSISNRGFCHHVFNHKIVNKTSLPSPLFIYPSLWSFLDPAFLLPHIQRWIQRWVGVGSRPPYHPGSHGNPSKFSIEILRRKKEKEEEGGRRKKTKQSPYHSILDSPLPTLILFRLSFDSSSVLLPLPRSSNLYQHWPSSPATLLLCCPSPTSI